MYALSDVAHQLTLEEVRLEVDLEQVPAEALDRVVEGEDVHALAVLDVVALVDVHKVAELDADVVARDLVELDLALLDGVVGEHDQHRVAPLLAAHDDRVAAEERERLHRRRVQRRDAVVVRARLVDEQPVRPARDPSAPRAVDTHDRDGYARLLRPQDRGRRVVHGLDFAARVSHGVVRVV
jgi:hypothetical protein